MAKVLEFQLQYQSFQWIFWTDFLYDGLVGSPCSPRDFQESSPTPQSKSINSLVFSFLYSPTLTSIHDYWKDHSFDKMDLCWQSNVSAFYLSRSCQNSPHCGLVQCLMAAGWISVLNRATWNILTLGMSPYLAPLLYKTICHVSLWSIGCAVCVIYILSVSYCVCVCTHMCAPWCAFPSKSFICKFLKFFGILLNFNIAYPLN